MQKISIDEMKQIELEIMDEFDRICREHGFSYCLGYGSCLGAIRHKGFIPWDDDMDVVMPRADYERFIKEFNVLNNVDRYKLATYRDESGIYPFVKMVDTKTKVYENFAAKQYSTGVWIDIFPLDDVVSSQDKAFSRAVRIGLVRSLIVADPSVGSTAFVHLVKRVTHPVFSRMDPYKAARKIDENAHYATDKETGLCADLIGSEDPQAIFAKELFEPIEVDFEDRRYFAPSGYEEYLTKLY
ncbi:MAG: LicD family protein, partial [Raoultibacter sp.]